MNHMADDRVIEVEPEAIEPPSVLTEADRWLSEQREKVEARRGDFHAFDITDVQGYRDAKAQRKALRALIAEVDGDKKRMTKALRETLSRFNSEVGGILADLVEEDVQYKSEIDRWERSVVQEREARVEARYADEYPDISAQVPYSRLKARFGADWKADNYGTKEARVWQGVETACEKVAEELRTLGSIDATDDERTELIADYLTTLDMSSALSAARERRERREAVRRAEEERRAWEAQQEAARAAAEMDAAREDARESDGDGARVPVSQEPAQVTADDATAPQATPRSPVVTYVYEVEVPAIRIHEFIESMKAIDGAHGKCVRKVREQ